MKKIYLCLAASAFFIGCDPDNGNDTITPVTNKNELALKVTGQYPENTANIYDSAGQIHHQITTSYFESDHVDFSTTRIASDIEAIAAGNTDFMELKPISYLPVLPSRIDEITNNEAASRSFIISNSGMGQAAQNVLQDFITEIMYDQERQINYDEIYQYIIAFENGIMTDPSYSTMEKQRILTATSITRYSMYFASKHKRKPKDRDWEISVGSIVGGIEGDTENMTKAITESASIVIRHNY